MGSRRVVVDEFMSLDGAAENGVALFGEGEDNEVVVQTVLTAGIIDELGLVVAQTIARAGRKLLDGLIPIRLAGIKKVIWPTGSLTLDDRVIGYGMQHRPISRTLLRRAG